MLTSDFRMFSDKFKKNKLFYTVIDFFCFWTYKFCFDDNQ